MRLNESIPDLTPPPPTEAQALLKRLIDSTTESLPVDFINDRSDEIHKSIEYFFDNYYTKPNTDGQVQQCKAKLSLVEAEIINFFLDDSSANKPFLFVDHAGRGKFASIFSNLTMSYYT